MTRQEISMYSADARQGRSKAQRFDVISRGEALLNLPLACAAGRRRSHLIGFPECYLCSRRSLRGFNVSLIGVGSRQFSLCCSPATPSRVWPWRECCIWVAHGDFLAAAAKTSRGCEAGAAINMSGGDVSCDTRKIT